MPFYGRTPEVDDRSAATSGETAPVIALLVYPKALVLIFMERAIPYPAGCRRCQLDISANEFNGRFRFPDPVPDIVWFSSIPVPGCIAPTLQSVVCELLQSFSGNGLWVPEHGYLLVNVTGQIDVGGGQVKTMGIPENNIPETGVVVHQDSVDGLIEGVGGDAQAHGAASLGVEIYDQHFFSPLPQTGRQVQDCSCFGDAAFLIGHGDNPGARTCLAHPVFDRFSGNTVLFADLGRGELATLYPAQDGVGVDVEQPGSLIGCQVFWVIWHPLIDSCP
jgi:hypothetical protein